MKGQRRAPPATYAAHTDPRAAGQSATRRAALHAPGFRRPARPASNRPRKILATLQTRGDALARTPATLPTRVRARPRGSAPSRTRVATLAEISCRLLDARRPPCRNSATAPTPGDTRARLSAPSRTHVAASPALRDRDSTRVCSLAEILSRPFLPGAGKARVYPARLPARAGLSRDAARRSDAGQSTRGAGGGAPGPSRGPSREPK